MNDVAGRQQMVRSRVAARLLRRLDRISVRRMAATSEMRSSKTKAVRMMSYIVAVEWNESANNASMGNHVRLGGRRQSRDCGDGRPIRAKNDEGRQEYVGGECESRQNTAGGAGARGTGQMQDVGLYCMGVARRSLICNTPLKKVAQRRGVLGMGSWGEV